MSSYYDLTPAQKAQITRERKKREAEAYAAALESEGKPTRATKERAMDNAVWRGAAPTGHGPAPKTKVVPTAPQSRANPKAVMRPRDGRHPPPTLSDSDESVGAIRPPSKGKRTRQPEAERDEPADEPAGFAKQANQHDNPSLRPQSQGTTQLPQSRSAAQLFDDDGDDEDAEDDNSRHPFLYGDDNGLASDQDEDIDLAADPHGLAVQFRSELPRTISASTRSPSPVDIPPFDLDMTTSTEPEDQSDPDEVDLNAPSTTSSKPGAHSRLVKVSSGHRARARHAEKPQFVTDPGTPQSPTQSVLKPADTENTNKISRNTDPNSPNYGWPATAYYERDAKSPLALKAQPLALQQIIRVALRAAMGDFLFTTAYPSDENNSKYLRSLLRKCARRLKFY
ncbi:hypothetical protein BC835DRAFT_376782 [Cytidiella melzeri]|nr:hypothetical protein BC835DRAFT_376782 [Cytidiella melzeri]